MNDDPCYVDDAGHQLCPFSDWDSHNVGDGAGTHAWFSSEIFYAGQDVPGTSASPTNFLHIEEQDGPTFGKHRALQLFFVCSQYLTWFHHDQPGNIHFDIWTDPLPTHGNMCS